MQITIEKNGSTIAVSAPYNSLFVTGAKPLNGKWNNNRWIFDAREEALVRALCQEHYGTDGISAPDLVTIRIRWGSMAYTDHGPLSIRGRPLARAFGRDSGAKLADGVVVIEGGFDSGGSMKNWDTRCRPGTTVLVHDVPRSVAEGAIAAQSADDNRQVSIECAEKPPLADLSAERERLMERLAEIDAAIAEYGSDGN